MEEAKQKLRDRAEASRRRRTNARRYGSISDISSATISNDEPHKEDDDEEEISSIDDKSIAKLDAEIAELMATEESLRHRKSPEYVEVSRGRDDIAEESAC